MSDTDTTKTNGTRHQLRQTGTLLGDALQQVIALLRGELNLLRAEMDQNAKQAGAAIGMIVAGVVILLVALNVLASALVVGITELGLDAGWSALLVGVVFAAIAAILARKGVNDLKLTSLAPTRTAKNVERDGEAVKKAL
ncbi:phage holin family protein [Palleronia sp. LCG004]|uniref:phage holin family protein n=1 Tax=Palleronia sp. LCG004 TaxID=3079304 RepID=UPI002943F3A4|nr:phage holin family protein [Palleronia sp. LCG004]WOI57137.1 phage holin family protein [Palleronia sp. LCG004]